MGSTESNTTHIYMTRVLTWFARLNKYASYVLLFLLFCYVSAFFFMFYFIEKPETPFKSLYFFSVETGTRSLKTNMWRATQCQPLYTRQSFHLHSSLKRLHIPVRQISLTEPYCAIMVKTIMIK